MNVDRARFVALATTMMACHGDHLAPERIEVAAPAEVGRPPAEAAVVDGDAPVEQPPPPTTTNDRSVRRRCRELRGPSSACESLAETQRLCARLVDAVEPETAEATVACLERLARRGAVCSHDAAPRCFGRATQNALVEPDVRDPCRAAVKQCTGARWGNDDLDQRSCERAASAVRDERRGVFLSCVAESCGVARCLYDIVD